MPQLLSSTSSPQTRISVVQEGSVAAIAALLRNSTDVFTFQNCLLALCNLLYEPDNHLSIVQQGLIVTLINLSQHENELLKDFCALAFLNLSCAEVRPSPSIPSAQPNTPPCFTHAPPRHALRVPVTSTRRNHANTRSTVAPWWRSSPSPANRPA